MLLKSAIETLQKGVNIIKYKNGTSKKIVVKLTIADINRTTRERSAHGWFLFIFLLQPMTACVKIVDHKE